LAHTIAQGLLAGYDKLWFGLGLIAGTTGSSIFGGFLLFSIKYFLVNNLKYEILILLEFLYRCFDHL